MTNSGPSLKANGKCCRSRIAAAIAGLRRLQSAAEIGRGAAYNLAKRGGESRRRAIAYRQGDLGNVERPVFQKLPGHADPLNHEPFMRGLAGGEAKRRAEVEAAKMNDASQLIQCQRFAGVFEHVCCDPFHLPRCKPSRGPYDGDAYSGVFAEQLNTQQIDRLLHKEARGWLIDLGFIAEQFHDARRGGILKTDSIQQLNPLPLRQYIGAVLESGLCQINMRHLDGAGDIPARLMATRNDRDRSRTCP